MKTLPLLALIVSIIEPVFGQSHLCQRITASTLGRLLGGVSVTQKGSVNNDAPQLNCSYDLNYDVGDNHLARIYLSVDPYPGSVDDYLRKVNADLNVKCVQSPGFGDAALWCDAGREIKHFIVFENSQEVFDFSYYYPGAFKYPADKLLAGAQGVATVLGFARQNQPHRESTTSTMSSGDTAASRAAPTCAQVTAVLQKHYQHLPRLVFEPASGPPGSCTYTRRDNGLSNYPVGTMIVTMYGNHGKSIASYKRPIITTKDNPTTGVFDVRPVHGLGQIAEFVNYYYTPPDVPHASFTLYRNDRCVLDIVYQNWRYSGPDNNDYDYIGQLVTQLLGPYIPRETPLAEPNAPPR